MFKRARELPTNLVLQYRGKSGQITNVAWLTLSYPVGFNATSIAKTGEILSFIVAAGCVAVTIFSELD